jgi:hypothetical protein
MAQLSEQAKTIIIAIKTGSCIEIEKLCLLKYTNAEWYEILMTAADIKYHDKEYKQTMKVLLGSVPETYPVPLSLFSYVDFRFFLFMYLPASKLIAFAHVIYGEKATIQDLPEWFIMFDRFDHNLYVEMFQDLLHSVIERSMTPVIRICLRGVCSNPILKDVELYHYYTLIADHDMFDAQIIAYFRRYDAKYTDKYLSKKQIETVNAAIASGVVKKE